MWHFTEFSFSLAWPGKHVFPFRGHCKMLANANKKRNNVSNIIMWVTGWNGTSNPQYLYIYIIKVVFCVWDVVFLLWMRSIYKYCQTAFWLAWSFGFKIKLQSPVYVCIICEFWHFQMPMTITVAIWKLNGIHVDGFGTGALRAVRTQLHFRNHILAVKKKIYRHTNAMLLKFIWLEIQPMR